MTLKDLLTTRPYGAAETDLTGLEGELGRPLPPDLREFLAVSDGSEWTKFPVLGIQVHAVATMLGLWRVNRGLVDVATDGSRERFCLDGDAIVWTDVTGDQPPVTVAQTLTEFVTRLSEGWDPWPLLK
jgi:cell wall assembly regulator SMI1